MGSKKLYTKRPQPPLVSNNTEYKQFLSFSWKHFESTKKFNIKKAKSTYLEQLVNKLQELSNKNSKELLTNSNYKKAFRMHPISWQDTTENGFKNLPHYLQDIQPWQFSITANKHGRIHGFFIDNTFYVVWFDPDHLLYSK